MPTVTRTVVAVHGIASGGNAGTAGYTSATSATMTAFMQGMGSFQVPFAEALWADLAEQSFSHADGVAAQAAVAAALGPAGAIVGGAATVLGWFGVPTLADVADMIADVFIYDGARVPPIRDHVRATVEAAAKASGRGVVLHGNSLGSVVAMDVLLAMIGDGAIGPSVPVDQWPVRALLTTGSPLGLDLSPLVAGFTDRAPQLSHALAGPLGSFTWDNVYDQNDPVVSGSIFGNALGGANLVQYPGYGLLSVSETTIQAGQHLVSHVGYWKAPLVAQTLFKLVNQ